MACFNGSSLNVQAQLCSSDLSFMLLPQNPLMLTDKGRLYLSLCNEKDQKRTDEKRKENDNLAKAEVNRKKQFKHDWLVSVTSAVVGAVLTLIIEHFSEILAFLF